MQKGDLMQLLQITELTDQAAVDAGYVTGNTKGKDTERGRERGMEREREKDRNEGAVCLDKGEGEDKEKTTLRDREKEDGKNTVVRVDYRELLRRIVAVEKNHRGSTIKQRLGAHSVRVKAGLRPKFTEDSGTSGQSNGHARQQGPGSGHRAGIRSDSASPSRNFVFELGRDVDGSQGVLGVGECIMGEDSAFNTGTISGTGTGTDKGIGTETHRGTGMGTGMRADGGTGKGKGTGTDRGIWMGTGTGMLGGGSVEEEGSVGDELTTLGPAIEESLLELLTSLGALHSPEHQVRTHCTVLCCAVLCCAVLYCAVLC